MCGIVGLYLKDEGLRPQLGRLLADMLETMSDRGPDSAGIAIYGDAEPGRAKITVQSETADDDFAALESEFGGLTRRDTHAVLNVGAGQVDAVRARIAESYPGVRVMSSGEVVEIYKEVGLPDSVIDRFEIRQMGGSHGVGHTRMATESAVTTLGAHPFSTDEDQCLVHNGSLSNHNRLRRKLEREGVTFETENDTEVGAAYFADRMRKGDNLDQALNAGISDLDGFYTFVCGTKDGFAVLRDPIACKPAVLAETDRYVSFGSEYRALVNLPGIEDARVWEPEPGEVYAWGS
ncbi:MAG: glutamine amidotransferase family protein [Pseudomonadota bacterium]